MSQNAFQYSILASGSTGNAFYLETPTKKLLVDAGLSGKKITDLLHNIGRDPKELDAIFVTHEHVDHIHGVGVLARKHGTSVYANDKTWEAMAAKVGDIPLDQRHHFERGTTLTFGDIDIESFGVSHDAVDPQFYRFMKDGKSFVLLTDTGYVSDKLVSHIADSDAYLIEANHDLEILRHGSYSWHLKQRILSDIGHLSNEAGADAVIRSSGNRTKAVYLGHLSQENNNKEIAHLTVTQELEAADIHVGTDILLCETFADRPTPLRDIDQ